MELHHIDQQLWNQCLFNHRSNAWFLSLLLGLLSIFDYFFRKTKKNGWAIYIKAGLWHSRNLPYMNLAMMIRHFSSLILARALILYWLRIISNFSFYVTDNPLPEALIYTLYSEYKEVFLHTTPLGRCNGFNKSLEKLPMMLLLLSLIPMRLLFSQFLQVSNVK